MKYLPLCIIYGLISFLCFHLGSRYFKYTSNKEYTLKLYDSISMSYDKSYGILKSQAVIIDSYDSLGFDNTLMLMRKMDSLNNIEKEKREKYGKNIHKGNL